MGMSASQARLLFISSRMNDVEFKSQQIANQKIRLSSESEQLANDYAKALDKQTIKMNVLDPNAIGGRSEVDLNYKNLIANGYNIRRVDGSSIVSQGQKYNSIDEVPENELLAAGYTVTTGTEGEESGVTVSPGSSIRDSGITIEDLSIPTTEDSSESKAGGSLKPGLSFGGIDDPTIKPDIKDKLKDRIVDDARPGIQFPRTVLTRKGPQTMKPFSGKSTSGASSKLEDSNEVLLPQRGRSRRSQRYRHLGLKRVPTPLTPAQEKVIKDANGNVVDEKTALEKINSNSNYVLADADLVKAFQENPDYLIQGLLSGVFVLEAPNKETGKMEQVSLSTDTNFNIKHDKSGDAKAEAEYNAASLKLKNKEKILDNELNKLNTEHEALKTEYDSAKTIIKDNISRSFNLFS